MSVIDLGIGTQIIPLYELADTLGMEESKLALLCRSSGLNLIKHKNGWWVGMWQFRLLMTHLLGFNGQVLNWDDEKPTVQRMLPEDLRIALGQLLTAKQVHKGTMLTELPRLQKRAASRWSYALQGVQKAMTEDAMQALEEKGLTNAT